MKPGNKISLWLRIVLQHEIWRELGVGTEPKYIRVHDICYEKRIFVLLKTDS